MVWRSLVVVLLRLSAATLSGSAPGSGSVLPFEEGQVMTIYQHIRHPRTTSRLAERPVRVSDMLPRGTAMNRFNTRLALIITKAVGSMYCAYAFALFDLISLPAAIRNGPPAIVSWVAQTFLQLVLLSIIMVGQNVQAEAADKRAEATFHDASAALHELAHVQGHLAAQDVLLSRIAEKVGLEPVPVIDDSSDEPVGPGDVPAEYGDGLWSDSETAGQDKKA
jgi:hypothetical protein